MKRHLVGLVLMLASVAVMFPGCAGGESYRLRVVSEPPGAQIAITGPDGAAVGRPPPGSDLTLNFEPSTTYRVVATPVGDLEETHRATTVELRQADVHFLPGAGGTRTYRVRLTQKESAEQPTCEALFVPGRGLMAVRTRRRAYDKVVESEGSPVEPVMPIRDCDGVRGMALSPRGDRIAYAAFEMGPPGPEPGESPTGLAAGASRPPDLAPITRSQIRTFFVRGTGQQSITTGKFIDLDPGFSPDGAWLVYAGNRDRLALHDVYRQGAAGRTAISVVTHDLGARSAFWPAEGAGGLVAFGVIAPGARSLADADLCTKGGPNGYLSILQNGVQPAVSPDGKRIAYIYHGDLYIAEADGSREFRLTTDAEEITGAYRASLTNPADRERFDQVERQWLFLAYANPVWTADGRWILVASMKYPDTENRPGEDILAISADGAREVRLTSNPSVDRYPMISPDGKSLYFLSNRGKQWAVWRMAIPDGVLAP